MRRLLPAIACLCAWFAGCDGASTESAQDKSKANPRPMVKPGPNAQPTPVVTADSPKK